MNTQLTDPKHTPPHIHTNTQPHTQFPTHRNNHTRTNPHKNNPLHKHTHAHRHSHTQQPMCKYFLRKTHISNLLLTYRRWKPVENFHVQNWHWPSYPELHQPRPYTADSFQLFVRFSFVFCIYTELSSVNTDYLFCW